MPFVLRLLLSLVSLSLVMVAVGAFAVYAFGILDPKSLQMANDGDPFGTPPSLVSSAVGCLISLSVLVGGAWATSLLLTSRHVRSSLLKQTLR